MLNRYLRGLPWFLATVHTLLTIVIFWVAITNMERAGLLPIIMFFADLPASLLIEEIFHLIGAVTNSGSNYLLAGATYLVLGTAWWYGIGKAFGWAVIWIAQRIKRTT